MLLSRNAQLDARNNDREIPLALTAQNGHSSTTELLLSWSAEVNNIDNGGYTLLALALSNEAGDTIRESLDH